MPAHTPPAADLVNCALIVAHPGHEVRLHGWLEQNRPHVYVLTDGSGNAGQSRLDATAALLKEVGAREGAVFGRFAEREFYGAVLERKVELFARLVEELAESLAREDVTCVVGDAAEGYNSTHDLCRLIADVAIRLARGTNGHHIKSYDYTVVGPPDECPAELSEQAVWLRHDEASFARKIGAARRFFPELLDEVTEAFGGRGEGGALRGYLDTLDDEGAGSADPLRPFRVECLRPANGDGGARAATWKPFYESHGERQVTAGIYERVIRYREHVLPIADALWSRAGGVC